MARDTSVNVGYKITDKRPYAVIATEDEFSAQWISFLYRVLLVPDPRGDEWGSL